MKVFFSMKLQHKLNTRAESSFSTFPSSFIPHSKINPFRISTATYTKLQVEYKNENSRFSVGKMRDFRT